MDQRIGSSDCPQPYLVMLWPWKTRGNCNSDIIGTDHKGCSSSFQHPYLVTQWSQRTVMEV